MQFSANTLLDFAKKLRATVGAIAPHIRMSACAVLENWDYCGTDMIEDAKLQAKWCRDNGVEVFSEGDVYPRPRYRCSSKRLELYDM